MINIQKKIKSIIFQQLLLVLFIYPISCIKDIQEPKTNSPLTILNIVIGVVFILIGLVFLFVGNRILKFTLFLAGIALFAYLTFITSNAIINLRQATKAQKIAVYVSMGVLGLIGGILALCILPLGLALLGGCFGVCIGILINSMGIIHSKAGQVALVVILAVVFAILTFSFSNALTIVASSGFGATVFMLGVNIFAKTEFSPLFSNHNDMFKHVPGPKGWAMIGSTIVLTLIGTLVQFKTRPILKQ